MIIQRIYVQNSAVVLPSTFSTSTEITSVLRVYSGNRFYIIEPENFTPCLTVEKQSAKIVVTATSIANARKVFDSKITSKKANKLPARYIFYFNLDGKVLSVRNIDLTCLSLDAAKRLVVPTKLSMVPHSYIGSKIKFLGLFLKSLLGEKDSTPWEGVTRTGFRIGDEELRHTNKIALPGIVAAAIPLDNGVRIKGIYKHASDYAETVFWFELKQCAPTIFEILKEEELKSNFMEYLDKCL